jgi:hypothetical protein
MVVKVVVVLWVEGQVDLEEEVEDMELDQQDLHRHQDREMLVDLLLHSQVLERLLLEVVEQEEQENQVLEMRLGVMVDLEYNFPQHLEIQYQVLDSQDHLELIGLQVAEVVEDIIQQVLALVALDRLVVDHMQDLEMVILLMVMVQVL